MTGPFARYCRTTISVAAGAVAAAIAPKRSAIEMRCVSLSFGIRSSAPITNSTVVIACTSVMTMMRTPSFLMYESLNSPPIENAIKPSAMSVIGARDCTASSVSRQTPSPKIRGNKKGPINRPANR